MIKLKNHMEGVMKSLKWRMVGINCMIILFCLLFVVIICFSLFFKELNTASYDKYNMQAQKCSEELQVGLQVKQKWLRTRPIV